MTAKQEECEGGGTTYSVQSRLFLYCIKTLDRSYKCSNTGDQKMSNYFSDPPFVLVAEPWVHAGEGSTVTLRCQVGTCHD